MSEMQKQPGYEEGGAAAMNKLTAANSIYSAILTPTMKRFWTLWQSGDVSCAIC